MPDTERQRRAGLLDQAAAVPRNQFVLPAREQHGPVRHVDDALRVEVRDRNELKTRRISISDRGKQKHNQVNRLHFPFREHTRFQSGSAPIQRRTRELRCAAFRPRAYETDLNRVRKTQSTDRAAGVRRRILIRLPEPPDFRVAGRRIIESILLPARLSLPRSSPKATAPLIASLMATACGFRGKANGIPG